MRKSFNNYSEAYKELQNLFNSNEGGRLLKSAEDYVVSTDNWHRVNEKEVASLYYFKEHGVRQNFKIIER